MSKVAELQRADEMASSYRTEVLDRNNAYSWNAAIHYTPSAAAEDGRANTVKVSVGSISALVRRFG